MGAGGNGFGLGTGALEIPGVILAEGVRAVVSGLLAVPVMGPLVGAECTFLDELQPKAKSISENTTIKCFISTCLGETTTIIYNSLYLQFLLLVSIFIK